MPGTNCTSGRRPADALVQGAGAEAGKRVASIASIVLNRYAAWIFRDVGDSLTAMSHHRCVEVLAKPAAAEDLR